MSSAYVLDYGSIKQKIFFIVLCPQLMFWTMVAQVKQSFFIVCFLSICFGLWMLKPYKFSLLFCVLSLCFGLRMLNQNKVSSLFVSSAYVLDYGSESKQVSIDRSSVFSSYEVFTFIFQSLSIIFYALLSKIFCSMRIKKLPCSLLQIISLCFHKLAIM
jgi:hypothetical protein